MASRRTVAAGNPAPLPPCIAGLPAHLPMGDRCVLVLIVGPGKAHPAFPVVVAAQRFEFQPRLGRRPRHPDRARLARADIVDRPDLDRCPHAARDIAEVQRHVSARIAVDHHLLPGHERLGPRLRAVVPVRDPGVARIVPGKGDVGNFAGHGQRAAEAGRTGRQPCVRRCRSGVRGRAVAGRVARTHLEAVHRAVAESVDGVGTGVRVGARDGLPIAPGTRADAEPHFPDGDRGVPRIGPGESDGAVMGRPHEAGDTRRDRRQREDRPPVRPGLGRPR